MACLRNWILLVGLVCVCLGQKVDSSKSVALTDPASATGTTSTSRMKTITTPSPSQTLRPLSSYVWHLPFVGISDNASDAWGPYGQTTGDAYSIVINDSNPVASISNLNRSTDILWDAYAESNAVEDGGYELNIITKSSSTMILGVNSALDATYLGVHLNETVPTVPFGLNLGHNDTWRGSLILGGCNSGASYDGNRVANGSWYYIPESANGTGTFLQTGKQQLTNVTIQRHSSSSAGTSHVPSDDADPRNEATTYRAVLDISSDAIILPSGLNLCNTTNFTVTLNTRSIHVNSTTSYENNLVISIPTSLTQSKDRCYNSPNNATDSRVILGRPFFQAAYLMIPDQSGQIWLAAAHQYPLFPKARPFVPNQTLVAAAGPSATSSSSSTASPSSATGATDQDPKSKTASIIGGTLGTIFGLALASLIAFLVYRHRKLARSYLWKPMPTEIELLKRSSTDVRDG